MSSDNSNIEHDIKKDKYHLLSKKINSLVDKLDFQHLQWLLQGNFIINEDSTVSIFESKNHEPLKDISIGNDDEIYKDSIISNISKKGNLDLKSKIKICIIMKFQITNCTIYILYIKINNYFLNCFY